MRPAEQLVGVTLNEGWEVRDYAARGPTATGGCFSTGYIVRNSDGRQGFMKAMDYTAALQDPNTPAAMKLLNDAYLFELNICFACKNKRLTRVVHPITSGSLTRNPQDLASKVEYLIFELAEGDIRAHLDHMRRLDTAFILRTLHNAAVGLKQLHSSKMAHQDLKPSNVLVFKDQGSKLSDLGRAWSRDIPSPFDSADYPGDPGYAPPECLYGYVPSDAVTRRFGADLYHFGSLFVFFFCRINMNGLLYSHVSLDHRPFSWNGGFEDVLPYLHAAFALALEEFSTQVPEPIRSELSEMLSQLCNPDPLMRGHPKDHTGHRDPFSVDRYIGQLDRLARKYEYGLLGS